MSTVGTTVRADSMPMSLTDTVCYYMETARVRKDAPLVASLVLLAGMLLAYFTKPDGLAGVTIWPFWVWLIPGALILAIKLSKGRTRRRAVVLLVWIFAWALISEEPSSLARSVISPKPHNLRVVSLNCAGMGEAAMEVVDLSPDIVLLQESMGVDAIEKLRARLGGDWTAVVGVDASILARGDLIRADNERATNFTMAWLGDTLIVSLRLAPPVFRLDYWNPACWSAYAENKRKRRAELSQLIETVSRTAAGAAVIIGGDFNTPPDHTVTASFSDIAEDAFAGAGRGWGATAINSFPMVRIDQIWASEGYSPVNAFAQKTKHSDHQMAVADFENGSSD